jgi:biotin carboxyl carrier protein
MADELKELNIDDTLYETTVPDSFGKPWVPPNDRLINAFIPGTVIEVKTEEGQTVEQGEVLLILDAMKMYNEITAPFSSKVKRIAVKTGQQVEKNHLLIELE